MLKVLYIIAIGLLFAAVVGFGIAAFYKAPTPPEMPVELTKFSSTPTPADTSDPAIQKAQDDFNLVQSDFSKRSNDYQRNLSISYLVAAVLIIAISVVGLGTVDIIGDGITLGGVFLLFVGIANSFGANGDIFRFIASAVGLVVVVFLTYWKFLRGQSVTVTGQ